MVRDARGREVARTAIPALPAPSDLLPKTVTVQLALPTGFVRAGARVQVMQDGEAEEADRAEQHTAAGLTGARVVRTRLVRGAAYPPIAAWLLRLCRAVVGVQAADFAPVPVRVFRVSRTPCSAASPAGRSCTDTAIWSGLGLQMVWYCADQQPALPGPASSPRPARNWKRSPACACNAYWVIW